MRARNFAFVLLMLAMVAVGCTDIRNIVGSAVSGCDNKAEFIVRYGGNPIYGADVCLSDGGCYGTNEDGQTVEICTGTTRVLRGTYSYGQISRAFEVGLYQVGLNTFYLDL